MNSTLLKKSQYIEFLDIDLSSSYEIEKKKNNKGIGTLKLYSKEFINSVVTKTVNTNFKKILKLILDIDDDPNPDGTMLVISHVEKFKLELINKNRKYLKKKEYENLLKKIEKIEKELKNKVLAYQFSRFVSQKLSGYQEEVYDEELETRRRR